MEGFRFSRFEAGTDENPFERLLKLFKEILLHASGDVDEAINWLTELDRQYKLTDDDYGIGDFIEELKRKGYLNDDPEHGLSVSPKTEREMRRDSLNQIFGKLKKGRRGNHGTRFSGQGEEGGTDRRAFEFGDPPESISLTDSIRNAQVNHGIGDF